MSLRAVKQQLRALSAEIGQSKSAEGPAEKVKHVKDKAAKKKAKTKHQKQVSKEGAKVGPAAVRERNLRYLLAKGRSEARVQELMRKALGLPVPDKALSEETDEDLLALFG